VVVRRELCICNFHPTQQPLDLEKKFHAAAPPSATSRIEYIIQDVRNSAFLNIQFSKHYIDGSAVSRTAEPSYSMPSTLSGSLIYSKAEQRSWDSKSSISVYYLCLKSHNLVPNVPMRSGVSTCIALAPGIAPLFQKTLLSLLIPFRVPADTVAVFDSS